jgi:1,4-dihydroxy-6-naphthoate synthase
MKLSLGFSPCPNDTFIFDALVNNKINTGGLQFGVVLEDVQTLNEWALQGKLDISKISYGVLPIVTNEYTLLESGGALGKGVGPLLITPKKQGITFEEVNDAVIAIPGKNTTAHMLFTLAFPRAKKKLFKMFNEIEDVVLSGEAHAGVIIHENRFTYQLRGLHKLMDLGDYWEKETGLSIPLGGIVAKRSLEKDVIKKVDALIKRSVEHAYQYNYKKLSDFVKMHAQEMHEKIMRQHIDLYVNNYSIGLGTDGRSAVVKMVEIYQQLYPSQPIKAADIFLQE